MQTTKIMTDIVDDDFGCLYILRVKFVKIITTDEN